MRTSQKILLGTIIFLVMSLFFSTFSMAMESTTYKVDPDVLNQAGDFSDSANYRLWHNLGESITGETGSDSYRIHQGYWRPEPPGLFFSISSDTVNFGTFSTAGVSAQSITVTVSTGYNKGFNVQAYDNTPTGIIYGLIADTEKIADATTPSNYINLPLAGVEHYGITVTGSHAASGYAGGTKINSMDNTSLIDIGGCNHKISNDTYNVEFRASISEETTAHDNYSATTTFIVTGNY